MSKTSKRTPKIIEDEHAGGRKIRNHLRRVCEEINEVLELDDESALLIHREEMEHFMRNMR